MNHQLSASKQSRAMAAAKLAVRRYARNPSDTNAEHVARAWRRIRELTVATGRGPAAHPRLTPGPSVR